ncbi:MAG: hypothetical protein IT328_09580 [Caldilineaceae bacterium]|nr:hypothetical protein [Caldilineaceae bacterium]
MNTNTLQPPLLEGLQATVQPKVAKEATIQERFESFHAHNPHVYAALRTLALQMLGNGVRAYGIKGLFEILRWQFSIQTGGKEEFRLSNDFTSRYARLLVELNPELDGFFTLRELRAE